MDNMWASEELMAVITLSADSWLRNSHAESVSLVTRLCICSCQLYLFRFCLNKKGRIDRTVGFAFGGVGPEQGGKI